MADPISVTLSNESGRTIQTAKIYHSASEPDIESIALGDYDVAVDVSNLLPTQVSSATSVPSEWMPGDYWFGTIVFADDASTTYYIAGYVSTQGDLFPPFKECNVPSGGSARISIKLEGNNANGGYIYVSNSDGSDDGGANFGVFDSQSMLACALLTGLGHAAI